MKNEREKEIELRERMEERERDWIGRLMRG